MKRSILKVQMGQNKVQEVVRIESDATPGPADGIQGFQAFWFFVQSLQTNPTLLRNSVDCPETFAISYNGRSWVAESRAIVDASTGPA